MLIWFIFAGMTAAVVAALSVPFLRKLQEVEASDVDFEQAIYRDQLQELERDQQRGIIAGAEADAARNEISRRLLQATAAKSATGATHSPLAKFAVLLVPLIALPLYSEFGSPKSADVPLQDRLKGAITNQDFAALVATVESHLAANPKDIKGWEALAPAYKREKRWVDAAEAYANILRLAPASAEGIADYAEMVVVANEGMVTADAQNAFAEALKLDPKDPRGRFYTALGMKQEGKPDEARQQFESLLADSPSDAPWRTMVEDELSGLTSARAPALSQEQVAAVQSMPAGDQAAMIKGMIEGLEQRLGNDSRDLEGWLRLIRARRVSNDTEKAKGSLQTALMIFKDDPKSLDALNSLAKEMGIVQ
jgi:cytochrome c-type biogenesis protein CcmH